jgi:hypothetical protein
MIKCLLYLLPRSGNELYRLQKMHSNQLRIHSSIFRSTGRFASVPSLSGNDIITHTIYMQHSLHAAHCIWIAHTIIQDFPKFLYESVWFAEPVLRANPCVHELPPHRCYHRSQSSCARSAPPLCLCSSCALCRTSLNAVCSKETVCVSHDLHESSSSLLRHQLFPAELNSVLLPRLTVAALFIK